MFFDGSAVAQTQIFDPVLVGEKEGNGVTAMAFGDVDLDGKLDMLMGRISGIGAECYRNSGDPVPYSESDGWRGYGSEGYALALGDLDGDHDLDVVIGIGGTYVAGWSNYVHRFEGGHFLDHPTWTSSTELNTQSVALGDVDGDGDLDLVVGNGKSSAVAQGQPNTLFLNQWNDGVVTIFLSQPDWQSELANISWQVALGDLDGDGDLDLICVDNVYDSPDGQISIYLNRYNDGITSVFLPQPEPESLIGFKGTLALGDLDGDGDLDLVTNDINGFGVVLLNVHDDAAPTIFDSTPAWTSQEDSVTTVMLGDLDSDGDLDLVNHAYRWADNHPIQVYLNRYSDGGTEIFTSQPVQEIESYDFQFFTLADVNGDGGLDLACGSWGGHPRHALVMNARISFPAEPAEPTITPPAFATQSVALGDIDADGWPDLVCGNDGFTRVYPNLGGVLAPVSFWNTQATYDTPAIALGDVNNDGYLDLVCGNYLSGDQLYLHDHDVSPWFPPFPGWTSAASDRTTSVALGDVDGDGWLDLICGSQGERNRLYRNLGGTFSVNGTHISQEARATRSVALGDMDSDGDLDLICGNDGQSNTIYLNNGCIFETEPVWESAEGYSTWSVAVGDVDGDGFLDLVCGNGDQGVAYYRNFGGSLTNPQGGNYQPWPPILSTASTVRSVILKDMDADGDLDLLCGNNNGQNALYWNVAGEFSEPPNWLSAPANATLSLAVGDLDRDGDYDLVCGNHEQVNTVYYGLRNPICKHDPAEPTHHLVNTDAYLDSVSVERSGNTEYRVSFKAVDPESDDIWVVPEYQYDISPEWFSPSLPAHPTGGAIGPLLASPAGIVHEFFWDVSRLDFDPRNVIVRLRTISHAGTVGVISRITNYQEEIGPLDIRRAEVAVTPDTVRFARVTLGDTVSAVLTVANIGNEPLEVSEVVPPSTEMWFLGPSTFTVQPGESHIDTLMLGPRVELNVDGDLQITSNAPRMPTFSVPVQTDIRALTVGTRILVEGETAPLGEALTVQVIPDAEVNLPRCALNYRPQDSADPFTSIEMVGSGRSFIGVIPGSDVTELGLEYFIELENSGVFASDPLGAPADSVFTIAVAAPVSIAGAPIPNAELGFLSARPIRVDISLPQGTIFQQGSLNYRQGGEVDYQILPLQRDETSLFATIPSAAAGPRGVEYWVEVVTGTQPTDKVLLTDPPADAALHPHVISIAVPDLAEPTVFPAWQYRMISIPLRFSEEFSGTLEALLAEQSEFGPYPTDPHGRWRCFRRLAGEEDYVELNHPDHTADFRPEPGRGFWVICREDSRITTAPITGFSTPTDSSFPAVLKPGWNMVGHPFAFPVSWQEVLVDGQPPTSAEIEGDPRAYDGSPYSEVTTLEPFAAYWIFNITSPERDLLLSIPPREVTTVLAATKDDCEIDEDILWYLTITASCAGVHDSSNRLGVAVSASESWDRLDRHQPPPVPERSLCLYFPHTSWEDRKGLFTEDFRPEPGLDREGHTWWFDVAKDFTVEGVGDEVSLAFDLVQSLPEGTSIILVDNYLGRTIDLRETESYSYFCGRRDFVADETEARFQLLVGSEEYIATWTAEQTDLPVRMALLQNRPNPFNPTTVIGYELDRSCLATIRIYDVSGSLVRTLVSEPHAPGRYEHVWRGEDDRGLRVSSGVYFYRLEAGDFVEMGKMALVR